MNGSWNNNKGQKLSQSWKILRKQLCVYATLNVYFYAYEGLWNMFTKFCSLTCFCPRTNPTEIALYWAVFASTHHDSRLNFAKAITSEMLTNFNFFSRQRSLNRACVRYFEFSPLQLFRRTINLWTVKNENWLIIVGMKCNTNQFERCRFISTCSEITFLRN